MPVEQPKEPVNLRVPPPDEMEENNNLLEGIREAVLRNNELLAQLVALLSK